MAVNIQKFLPSSKGGALANLKESITKISKPSSDILPEKSLENISVIKVKVIEVDKILKGTLASQKKKLDDDKKKESSKRREKIEEKLETKPKAETGKVKMPGLPKMGFLEWVKNFIGNIILGYFAVRLVEHLPKIVPIVKFLGNATDLVLELGGKLLDGLATFIDWGYKAVDFSRGLVGKTFGDEALKNFDKLTSEFEKFMNLAIIVGLASADFGMDRLKDRGAKKGAEKAAGTLGRRGAGRIATRAAARVGGKSAAKLTSKIGSKALKAIPFLGAALGITEGIMRMREGDVVGGLLSFGTAIPVAGWGFLALDIAREFMGGKEFDKTVGRAFSGKPGVSDKQVQRRTPYFSGPSIVTGLAEGGITRGGKTQGGPKRKIYSSPKRKYKRKLSPKKPGKVEISSPGSDVGGEQKLFGLFPDPFKMMREKASEVMNPFKVIKKGGENLGESDYFGPILAITSKILLGQKPNQEDYKNVGLGINLLVSKGIDDGKLRGGIAAFAEGGFVDPKTLDAISQGSDISDWVAKSFKDATETNAQKTLREIQENLRLSPASKPQELDPTLPVDGDTMPGMTTGQWGPLLDLIASVESGNSYESLNPSTTLPGATKMTISRVAAEAERVGKSKGGTGAVGRYQQLPWYLVSRAKASGLNPDKDLFSPENQDLIVSKVNIEQNRSGRRWLKNEISDEQFMQGLSQEFAAIPNAQGVFYYKRQKSSMTPQKVKEALGKVKKGGYSQKELSQVENVKMGKGYGKGGQKIAGDLGDFMKANKSKIPVTGSIHRHPRHLPWEKSGHSVGSLHYQGRAIDLGGWAPSNKNSGGRDEQAPVIKSIIDWNKRNGYSPVQLIHHSPKYRNIGSYQSDHNDHVHVAYEKGGLTLGKAHMAMLGEKGKEFVIDADSTAAIEQTFPGFLGAINRAKYDEAIEVLRNFASYESGAQETVVVMTPPQMSDDNYGMGGSSGGISMIFGGGEESDPFEFLELGM